MKTVCIAIGLSALLAGCSSGPPTRIFLLATPVVAGGFQAANGASVQVQNVLIPDYLDTTDILTRTGIHEVVASRTGRWGERLSQGITHALQASLNARLLNGGSGGRRANSSAVQLLVTVDAFDVWPDGHCVLTAHWTISRSVADTDGRSGHGSFASPPAPDGDDAARVAAMAGAVDQLSARIASKLQGPGAV